jgi:hypothetical protein
MIAAKAACKNGVIVFAHPWKNTHGEIVPH